MSLSPTRPAARGSGITMAGLTPGRPDSLFGRSLPPGGGPAAVTAEQRARLLDAMTRVIVRKGYERTTVADVVERSGISRRTFYEHFVDKEAAFLAAYETASDELIAEIAAAVKAVRGGGWAERLHAALETWTGVLAADPELARLFLLDVVGAGPKAIALRRTVLERFAAQLRGLRATAAAEEPEIAEVPDALLRGLVGGMHELVGEHVHDHGAASLPKLVPILEDFAHAVLGRPRVAAARPAP